MKGYFDGDETYEPNYLPSNCAGSGVSGIQNHICSHETSMLGFIY